VLSRWDEAEVHDAFVKLCSQKGALSAAGRCYWDKLCTQPCDVTALAMQKRIVGMATVLLGPPPEPPARSFVRSPYFVAILITFAVLGMVGGMLIDFGS